MSVVRIRPPKADYAFPNTMKGQRGQISAGGHCFHPGDTEFYSRLYKVYFNWNELERTAEDGEDFIREVCDRRFADCREYNVRIIPRVAQPRGSYQSVLDCRMLPIGHGCVHPGHAGIL